jgi:hypothetical protein
MSNTFVRDLLLRGFVWKAFVQRHFGAIVPGGAKLGRQGKVQIFLGIRRSEGAPKISPKKQNAPARPRRDSLRKKVYHISNFCQEKSSKFFTSS